MSIKAEKMRDAIRVRMQQYAEDHPPTTERGKRRRAKLMAAGLFATHGAGDFLHPKRHILHKKA